MRYLTWGPWTDAICRVESAELLVGQKNEVLALIQAEGMDPKSFQWDRVASYNGKHSVSVISYRPKTEFFFKFDWWSGDHYAEFSPARTQRSFSGLTKTWDKQLALAKVWVTALHAEVSEVDLWEALKHVPALALAPPAAGDDSPISGDDRTQFTSAMAEIKSLAAKEIRDPKQVAVINAIVDRTEAQSWTVSKRDLWNMFLGNVMAMVMSGVLTVENAQWMFSHLQGAVTWLVLASYSAVLSLGQ